jgi:hypothetical protein
MNPSDPDIRAGLPSASKLARVVQCPGSEALIKTLPPAALIQTPDDAATASRGTLIHKAREMLSDDCLGDEEDRELFSRGLEFERALVNRWMADKGLSVEQVTEGPREWRGWLHDPETMEPLASGQLDVHYIAKPHAFISDWKALWAWHVPPTPRSAQLRLQAVLLWLEHEDITEIRVSYVKPMTLSGGVDDFTDYSLPDLRFSLQHCIYQLWLSRQPEALRFPGAECRYCPAKPYCREAAAWSLLPSVQKEDKYTVIAPDPIALVQQMTGEDLYRVWAMAPLVGKILDAVKDRLKTFPDGVLAGFGLERTQGRKLDPIVDAGGLVAFLQHAGWTDAQIYRCMDFSKGRLAEVIAEREGLAAKWASKRVAEDFDQFIEHKRAEPSLRAIKGI